MRQRHDQWKTEHFTAGVLAIAGCFLMVAFPGMTQTGVREGLDLFVEIVFPTMFPFFILSNVLASTNVPGKISRVLEPLYATVFQVSGYGGYVGIVSLFSGYPMAAKLVGELCCSGTVTPLEGKKILTCSSFCGPLFIVGTVGTAMLGEPLYGGMILAGHYLGAIANGLIFNRFLCSPATAFGGSIPQGIPKKESERDSLFQILTNGILRAFSSMGLICGYIVLFSVFTVFLRRIGLGPMITGALEMTLGCQAAASAEKITILGRISLCAFLVSFGGISIAGQSLSMLAGSGIGARDYMQIKLSHGILAGILTYLLGFSLEQFGLFDLTAAVVYGSDLLWIQQLGRLHQQIYTGKSMIVVVCLMGFLVGMDHLIHGSYEKLHTYIIERRKNDR